VPRRKQFPTLAAPNAINANLALTPGSPRCGAGLGRLRRLRRPDFLGYGSQARGREHQLSLQRFLPRLPSGLEANAKLPNAEGQTLPVFVAARTLTTVGHRLLQGASCTSRKAQPHTKNGIVRTASEVRRGCSQRTWLPTTPVPALIPHYRREVTQRWLGVISQDGRNLAALPFDRSDKR
jgi:hypothetical protein